MNGIASCGGSGVPPRFGWSGRGYEADVGDHGDNDARAWVDEDECGAADDVAGVAGDAAGGALAALEAEAVAGWRAGTRPPRREQQYLRRRVEEGVVRDADPEADEIVGRRQEPARWVA